MAQDKNGQALKPGDKVSVPGTIRWINEDGTIVFVTDAIDVPGCPICPATEKEPAGLGYSQTVMIPHSKMVEK